MSKYSIILGALLHDIGKFVQRAQANPQSQNHSNWGVEWFDSMLQEKLSSISELDTGIVRSAISNHHSYEKYISLSDAISAGMDRIELKEEEKGDPFSERLISVFSRIATPSAKRQDMYHKLHYMNEHGIQETFPVPERHTSSKEYAALLEKLNNEIEKLDFAGMNAGLIINSFMFLLWKYTWCIPSAAYKHEPDISLFDHMKTTAASAACLYAYSHNNSKNSVNLESLAFRLIGGDISGIQSYIFGALKQSEKIAKRLRARSLYVQLISETACHKILHSFDLSLCNVLISAGGNFYILAPNTHDADDRLKTLQSEFDSWCLDTLSGEISINLADIKLSGISLMDFSKSLEKLKEHLHSIKCRPLLSAISEDGLWLTDAFIQPQVIESEEKVCRGCGKNPMIELENNKDALCERCFNDVMVGQKLPRKQYIAFFDHNKSDFEILNYSFALWDDNDLTQRRSSDPYLIFSLNSTQMKTPVNGFKFLATHVPRLNDFSKEENNSDDIASFNDIAGAAAGDKLLGYLKIDVDNLGTILREGFAGEHVKNKSISRYATLSRMLETFFCGYVNAKMESDFQQIYSVFSGGDDLFVIGPWDQAIRFAKEIRKDFGVFCSGNVQFCFSGGIIFSKPQEPVSFCSEAVEHQLELSKDREGKNCVTLFDQTVSWDELDRIVLEANRLIGWMECEPPLLSKGLAQNLLSYGEMSEQYFASNEQNIQCLKFVPLLSYDISRLLKKPEHRETALWAEDLKPSKDNPKGGEMLPFLKTIMDYVLTYTRKEKNYAD